MRLPFVIRSLPERIRLHAKLRRKRLVREARSQAAQKGHSTQIKRRAAQCREMFK